MEFVLKILTFLILIRLSQTMSSQEDDNDHSFPSSETNENIRTTASKNSMADNRGCVFLSNLYIILVCLRVLLRYSSNKTNNIIPNICTVEEQSM